MTSRDESPGATSSAAAAELDKFARLDQLVRSLIERHQQLQREHADLKVALADRDEQIRDLNQRRQDAGKRLDDVLSRLDQLDADLDRRLPLPGAEHSGADPAGATKD